MRLRVAVLCEGATETAGEWTLLPALGSPFDPAHLGPAHLLIERCLRIDRSSSILEVQFVAPARLRGRQARGSDLLSPKSLRKLVNLVATERAPHLVVVLVDTDGDRQRQTALTAALDAGPPILIRRVVGAAHQCFEAWLLGDRTALRRIHGGAIPESPAPDELAPDAAKQLLRTILAPLFADSGARTRALTDESEARRELARVVSLDELRKQRSFERFTRSCLDEARGFIGRVAG